MKNMLAMAVGTVLLLASGVSFAQSAVKDAAKNVLKRDK